MLRRLELTALVVTDFLFLSLGFLFYYMARFRWEWVTPGPEPPWPFVAMLFFAVIWMLAFLFAGLYREQYAPSRFDELALIVKIITFGSLGLFFAFYDTMLTAGSSRLNLLLYWAVMLVAASTGRVTMRSLQIAALERGYGLRKAMVVGWSDRVHELYNEIVQHPAPGLRIVGAIQMHPVEETVTTPEATMMVGGGDGAKRFLETRVPGAVPGMDVFPVEDLRSIQDLPAIVERYEVQDVLLMLGPDDQGRLTEVLQVCDGMPVRLKLVPDYYQILGGMARTEQIYGLPLIEVLPEPMRPWERNAKRLLDLAIASAIFLIGLPVWIAVGIMVRLTSPGPAIYKQERVGQDGESFLMFKFRTMRQDAESGTGPVWATENDPRYTAMGRWLRKTRLDEIPQLVNVIVGDMSLVGPRPERPFFVKKLVEQVPLYTRRLRVKPGITGLAQVKWKYDETVEDVKQKVKYDLAYISNMSIRLDLKILFATVRTALLGKGQ
ncbi:MAG: sugar transferase [Bacteroidota bacterium]